VKSSVALASPGRLPKKATTVIGAKIPTSRLGRLARLAALGTRAGAGQVAAALGGDPSGDAVAAAAADALGTMRGLALKLGQMASYVDGVVPERQREAYERTMKSLRDAAPSMSPEAAARVVEEELGAPPDALFASFSPEPFASASIGQVHRARLADGREVAVKVQYEGVARAVASDLSNASLFGALLGPIGTRFKANEQIAELRARFEEELDYGHEAARQREFAALFTRLGFGDTVRIPAVVDDRSSRRVLTTELAEGIGFEAACAAPEDERRLWAEALWTFVFGSLLQGGLFNADPHPGNYLFPPGRTAWFLDFGCTRALAPERFAQVRAAHAAATLHDPDGLVAAAVEMFDMRASGPQFDLLRDYICRCFAPILARGPYRITRAIARDLYDRGVANAVTMARGSRKDFETLPAEWLFFNRLQLGFYSVLARLDVEVDYNRLDAEMLRGEG
jgi:predicted unusual protein kinase regulating ubiquinone biosynthesis (AarF/ABC1/UbiB family)